jgi:transcription-repair coupling factor (superfamily II helicase)
MVSQAVSDLKGEVRREPAEIKLDLAVDAHLTSDYVAREDLRLEAYRRLAAVTTPTEVEDIRTEWLDRYGPLPPPAEALLAVGRLRAECVRSGVREITVTPARRGAISGGQAVARLAPLSLKASTQVGLRRRHPGAVYKEELEQVVVPLPAGVDVPGALVDLLGELVPAGADADAGDGSPDGQRVGGSR